MEAAGRVIRANFGGAAAMLLWLLLGCSVAWADDYGKAIKAYKKGEYEAALSFFMPSAKHGDPYSQFAIAVMYDDGVGKPQNFDRALEWYRRAAEGGLVDAQYMVGRFYGRGRGMPQNPDRALFWFNVAASGGHPDAPRLRDQQRSQVSRGMRQKIDDEAVRWKANHPQRYTCKSVPCIFPQWLQPPRWKIFTF
jgi:TPR repeat protein